MRKPMAVGAATFLTFVLGAVLAVFVAGSAVAASTTPTKTSPSATDTTSTSTTESPGDNFVAVNGSVFAASDHEIIGSSAFPNYAKGAVDNYYSLAHSHVDNSPFSEGLASPFDTGPIGQTAAAGNTQQPQYADARHPGDGKAEYGTKGGPYATATAQDYDATAEASVAANGLSGPAGPAKLAFPKAFDGRLRQALAGWKAKWQDRLSPKKPGVTLPTPKLPALPALPKPTVTTPVATVTTPTVGGVNVPTPTPVQAPPPPLPTPTVPSPTASAPSRSLAADSTPADGESLLSSSTEAQLVPDTSPPKTTTTTKTTKTKTKNKTTPIKPKKRYALATSGESSLGRVSLGGGQIVIEGIHVTASIMDNGDGSPKYKASISIASASIGGVPVTIDQDGVHVAGQGQGLPYQQASDALNNALKQAGIQLFLLAPQVTQCAASGTSGGGTDTTGTTTTETSTGQSSSDNSANACGNGQGGSCDQSGSGSSTPIPAPPTPGSSTDTTTTPSSCDQSTTTCDQMGSGSGTTTGTTTTAAPTPVPTGTGKTSTTSTTSTTSSSSCDSSGSSSSSTCSAASPAGTSPTSSSPGSDQSGSNFGSDPFGIAGGSGNAGELTLDATGVHVVFTQPVDQAGVPSQNIEHILGEVYVDSLVTPAGDSLMGLDLSTAPSSAAGSSCLGSGKSSGTSVSGSSASGTSSGGSLSSGSAASSGSSYGSASAPTSGSTTGSPLPVAFATALRKPLWLLLSYLVWQALVIGTGVSLWNWRRGDAS